MKDKSGMPRTWLYRGIRALEYLGLVTLIYGMASSRWLVAASGAIAIMASYAIYRRWFDVHDASVADDGE